MIFQAINKLIGYGIKKALITEDDVYFVRNRLIDVLSLGD